ncbi:PTS transporter subunit EIIB, partial [Burkholderia glumae]
GAAGGFAAAQVAGDAAAPRALRYIAALGGAANLTTVDACTTRLRLSVVDPEQVSEANLRAIGARGVLKRGGSSVQVIIGPEADLIADEIRSAIGSGEAPAAAPAATPAAAAAAPGGEAGPLDPDPMRWLAVFGGAANVASLDAVAATRLRVVVRDPSAVDRDRLASVDVAWVSTDTFHIICGSSAARYAQQMSARLPPAGGAAEQPA